MDDQGYFSLDKFIHSYLEHQKQGINTLPKQLQFPRVIGKGVEKSAGRDVCIACVNGTPTPLCAQKGRDTLTTRVQLRRLSK